MKACPLPEVRFGGGVRQDHRQRDGSGCLSVLRVCLRVRVEGVVVRKFGFAGVGFWGLGFFRLQRSRGFWFRT